MALFDSLIVSHNFYSTCLKLLDSVLCSLSNKDEAERKPKEAEPKEEIVIMMKKTNPKTPNQTEHPTNFFL
jgi:hypothetical protein